MSADLLRHAAAKLRAAAAAARADYEERWMVDQSPDDGLVLTSYTPGDIHDDGTISTSCIAYFAYPGDRDARAHGTALGVASYAALMHPPVALAVADLLEAEAALWHPNTVAANAKGERRLETLAAAARAILREPEGDDRG